MAEHQGPRRYAACKILVDGNDVTDKLDPYLISVQIIDTVEGGTGKCNIELDDRDAELQIPPVGGSLEAWLGWSGEGPRISQPLTQEEITQELEFGGPGMRLLFSGTVAQVESGFTRRGGGRRMWIEGTSSNLQGGSKEMQTKSWGAGEPDDAAASSSSGGDGGSGGGGGSAAGGGGGGGGGIPLSKVLQEMGSKAGVQVKLSPEMMKITRKFWHSSESLNHFGQRMAAEVGGLWSTANGVCALIGKNEGVNADGQAMGSIDAVWGVNLIGWRIKPFAARPQYNNVVAKTFDTFNAKWEHITKAIGGSTPFGGADATAASPNPVASKDQGNQENTGTETDSEAKRGTGWVLINGEPMAKAGKRIQIIGARPGVDGSYFMSEVQHDYTRGVGYQTRANLTNPLLESSDFPSWKRDPTPEGPPVPDVLPEGTVSTFDERFGPPVTVVVPK